MRASRLAPGTALSPLENPPSTGLRVVELDALRGLAALAVVAFHYTTHYGNEVGHIGPAPMSFAFGNYGVHLFFLISGFVIFMTLERTRTAMDFIVSRFSRLFPAYWAAILLSAAVVYSIGMPSQRLPWSDVALDFTMIQQILGAEHLDGSYWTLQVELFFYAQMLLWFVLGQLQRIRWIIFAWLVVAALSGLAEKNGISVSYTARELLILHHIPYFAIGILFYRMRTRPTERVVDGLLVGLCLVAIAIAYTPIYLEVAVICTAIFAAFALGWLRGLRWAPFAFLGTISYSLYLLHQAIGFSLIWQLENNGLSASLAAVCAAVGVTGLATLLTFLVERPAMRWIRRAWKRHREAKPTARPEAS
ncbi:acyltransferase family protein [Dokdonella immobilis]|uniref:Peptidoglycan/LPS O-acetylase OafA/YrhL, contains acyltransferase and SGNH-hydrolase domains n=1 Tax=Dokdonella immobilis TaxID=578942 RepID=A0A1I4VG46_9GAMM|nr:acyltransferase [Dokdonella immobilis]SFN00125.1 Peptidoglycan/LPS O-acetylase OafA/YrhL, contains acyltransferase and SGNH-hydrolase domains [Dokdonella immobilis]